LSQEHFEEKPRFDTGRRKEETLGITVILTITFHHEERKFVESLSILVNE